MKNNSRCGIRSSIFRMLPGVLLVAAIFSLRGISLYTLSLALLTLVHSITSVRHNSGNISHLQFVIWILIGASAFYGGDTTGVALLYTAILIKVVTGTDIKSRIFSSISLLPLLFEGSISGITPLLSGVLLSIIFRNIVLRCTVCTAGCIAGVIIFGIPSSSDYEPVFPEYEVRYERFDWHDSICVNLSHPELLFEVPDRFADDKRLYIQLRTGGVRNELPVGVITFDDITDTLYIGIDTLEFSPDVSRVTVSLLREWQPFNHPVIWIGRIWQDQ